MTTGMMVRRVAPMLMLASLVAGLAQAQTGNLIQRPNRSGRCTGGPFTLTSGVVRFHVALDDVEPAPGTSVALRIYDADGNIVAREVAALAVNKTTTLEFRGAGLFRAQASYDEPRNSSRRRAVVSSVELHDVDGFRIVVPVLCGDWVDVGR